jgi:hypothetical protein
VTFRYAAALNKHNEPDANVPFETKLEGMAGRAMPPSLPETEMRSRNLT